MKVVVKPLLAYESDEGQREPFYYARNIEKSLDCSILTHESHISTIMQF